MSNGVMKYTKIWFLVCAIIQFVFAMSFIFFWDLFFADLIKFPYTDPVLPLIFGTAAFGLSAMCLISFFEKEWSSVRIPVLAEIIWCAASIPAMLYSQFYIGLHPVNWMNTLSYALIMVGFIVAYILQRKQEKIET